MSVLRAAVPADAVALMRLYHHASGAGVPDSLFLDRARLAQELARKDQLWLVAEREGELAALVALSQDNLSRVGKVERMLALPAPGVAGAGVPPPLRTGGGLPDAQDELGPLLAAVMRGVSAEGRLELVYSTTRTLTLEQQAATLGQGFKVLGVFPNAVSADSHKLNGLTVWHAPGVLEKRRFSDFALHPAVAPFFELARKTLGLPKLKAAVVAPRPVCGPLPALELIEAPRFVAQRYRRLKERRSLSVNFYPFQTPNALFTSSDQSVELFAALSPERRFAGLIGERLAVPVDPVALYREAARILYERRINYIEIINDASDAAAIDAIVKAGFAPCGYFAALRDVGGLRRDFVVFARSFEFFNYTPLKIDGLYAQYLVAFCKARSTLPVPIYADASPS